MPRETVTINFDGRHVFEAGAQLLAALAYPDNLKGREGFRLALAAQVVRAMIAEDCSNRAMHVPAELLCARDSFYREGLSALNRRRIAGEMFLAIAMPEHSPPWMPKKVGVTGGARLASEAFGGEDDTNNNITRNWTPSLPVIHLAAAWARMKWVLLDEGTPYELGNILHDADRIAHLIGWATIIEREIVPGYRGRTRMPSRDEMIEFRLVGSTLSFFPVPPESDPASGACCPASRPPTSV